MVPRRELTKGQFVCRAAVPASHDGDADAEPGGEPEQVLAGGSRSNACACFLRKERVFGEVVCFTFSPVAHPLFQFEVQESTAARVE